MTYWKIRVDYNPCVNWRPLIYFAIESKCVNESNVKAFIIDLIGKEMYTNPKQVSAFEYLRALMIHPVTNHKNYSHFKKSVVIE